MEILILHFPTQRLLFFVVYCTFVKKSSPREILSFNCAFGFNVSLDCTHLRIPLLWYNFKMVAF